MREILCSFNLFDAKQTIYLCTEESQTTVGTTTIKNMAQEMLKRGEEWNSSVYHLVGNPIMAKKIANDLKTKYVLEYGIDDIEVRIN